MRECSRCEKEKLLNENNYRKTNYGYRGQCIVCENEISSINRKNRDIEYYTWTNIKTRCENKSSIDYDNYGRRGITICDRWRNSYENFIEDMGKRPSEHHTIERIDNDKGYHPNNCIWDTRVNQAHNRRMTSRNTSGKTGVYLRRDNNKWRASITYDSKKYDLGTYKKYEDAVIKRKEAELKHFGRYVE